MRADIDKPVTVEGYPAGINNRSRPQDLGEGELRDAVNVDIYDKGNIRRRDGYVSRLAGGHSLWSHPDIDYGLYVTGGELKHISRDLVATTIRTVGPTWVSYAELNGDVYWVNGLQAGKVSDGADARFGIPIPAAPVVSAISYGGMFEGSYEVVLTAVIDGEEGGASLGGIVEVPANGAIQVTLPQPDVDSIRIYVSPFDGDALYLAADVPIGVTSYLVSNTGRQELKTRYGGPPPAGKHICHHKGILYIADGKHIYHSDPYYHGLFNRRHGFLSVPFAVTGMVAVEDGMFIGTEKRTFFMQGTSPVASNLLSASDRGMVAYSQTNIPNHLFGAQDISSAFCAAWWDDEGVLCVGRNGGIIQRITENRVAITEKAQSASILYRKHNGIEQLIASLRSGEGASFGDSYDAEIITQNNLPRA